MSKTKATGEGFTLALALCASLLTLLCLSPLQAAPWFLQEIDPDSSQMTGIVLDLNKHVHIFYYSTYAPYQLLHSFWDGSGWTVRQVVAPCAGNHNMGPSAAFDAQGRIHVAYFHERRYPGYAWYDGTWHTEIIDSSFVDAGDWISMALDSQGNPHVAYFTMVGGVYMLRYAYRQGGIWVYRDGHPDWVAYDCHLVLDSLDHAHIVYNDTRPEADYYSTYDGASWTHETVVDSGAFGWTSLVLDRQRIPNISYWRGAFGPTPNYSLWFAQKDGGTWNSYVVDPTNQDAKRGWENKLVMTSDDTMHIAYHCHNESLLKHAWGDGPTWSNEVVDHIGPYWASIGFCADGNDLFMSYVKGDIGGGTLWLASTRELSGIEGERAQGPRPVSQEVRVSPNPFTSFAAAPGHEGEQFALCDVSGRRVGTYGGNRIGEGLSPGVYFLRSLDSKDKPLRIVKGK